MFNERPLMKLVEKLTKQLQNGGGGVDFALKKLNFLRAYFLHTSAYFSIDSFEMGKTEVSQLY
jgi:hypothetical protein